MKSLPKKNRHTSYKIPDIKVIRALSKLLGKLQIKPCYNIIDNTDYIKHLESSGVPHDMERFQYFYGYGLAEAKAFVEQWFNYTKELSPTEVPWSMFPRN